MYNVILITLIGTLISGIGTSLGAVLAVFFRKSNNIVLSTIMGIAGGLMLSVVTFDLIPESIEIGGMSLTLIGIFIGIVFVTILDVSLPETSIIKKYGKQIKAALILGIGLAVHNFPEGLAMGSGFVGGGKLGLEISLVIGLHDVPEGAAVAALLMKSNINRFKIILIALLTAVPTSIGVYIGALLGQISSAFITLCLGFAGGTMLYIVCGELIPQSRDIFKGVFSTISIMIGIIIGLLITTAF